ncbi:hypothetical protein DV736_g3609, partial [Chaetothyriales sp. CBS 134916]
MGVAVTFVVTTKEERESRKAYERQIAEIRSHAGKISAHKLNRKGQAVIYTQPDHSSLTQSRRPGLSTPWSWMNTIRVDPFNLARTKDDEVLSSVHDPRPAIQFLVTVITPLTASVSRVFGRTNVYGRWMLDHLAQFPDLVHAKAVLEHKYIAISRLRARLARPDATADDNAILTIFFLALVEDATGNTAAHKMHLFRVASMVEIRGGIRKLKTNPWIKAMVAQALLANAVLYTPGGSTINLWETDYHNDTTQILHLPNPQPPPTSVGVLPPGFQALAHTGFLSLCLSRFIIRIATTAASSRPAAYCPSDDERADNDMTAEHFHSFLASDLPLGEPDSPDGPSLEKAICLGLIRYVHLSAVGRGHKVCLYYSFGLMLTHAVRAMKIPTRSEVRQCFIWIWLIAVSSWSVGAGHLSAEGAALLQELPEVCPELSSFSVKQVKEVGMQYLWNGHLDRIVETNWTAGLFSTTILQQQEFD